MKFSYFIDWFVKRLLINVFIIDQWPHQGFDEDFHVEKDFDIVRVIWFSYHEYLSKIFLFKSVDQWSCSFSLIQMMISTLKHQKRRRTEIFCKWKSKDQLNHYSICITKRTSFSYFVVKLIDEPEIFILPRKEKGPFNWKLIYATQNHTRDCSIHSINL